LETVFHLGACSRITESDWGYLLQNNVAYSQSLWRWCARHGCPFYYASGAATYGDGSRDFVDRTPPDLLEPLNPYGRGKNDFDRWVLAEVDRGGPAPPAWSVLKFFNVYGPREAHKGNMASVVHHAARQARESEEVRLFESNDPSYPDGGQRRDFIFVGDRLDHLLWLSGHPHVSGIFKSGTGTSRTFEDLARAVFVALGWESAIRYVAMPEALGRQYQNFTQADMSKLRSAGFEKGPTPLEEGVRRTIGCGEAAN
jgi:ADP-L-glycero-D-manno-heptose 6-epimerase